MEKTNMHICCLCVIMMYKVLFREYLIFILFILLLQRNERNYAYNIVSEKLNYKRFVLVMVKQYIEEINEKKRNNEEKKKK